MREREQATSNFRTEKIIGRADGFRLSGDVDADGAGLGTCLASHAVESILRSILSFIFSPAQAIVSSYSLSPPPSTGSCSAVRLTNPNCSQERAVTCSTRVIHCSRLSSFKPCSGLRACSVSQRPSLRSYLFPFPFLLPLPPRHSRRPAAVYSTTRPKSASRL
jgi:hypothetical protein